MITDFFRLGYRSMRHRQLRSWLTILGVFIGIAAIVSLISLGDGLQNAISDIFGRMGKDTIMISPKGLQGPPTGVAGLTIRDAEVLDGLVGVDYVSPILMTNNLIEYNRQKEYLLVRGIDAKYIENQIIKDFGASLEQGSYYETKDTKVAIIGYGLAEKVFDKEILLRNSILIDGEKFRIIGILKSMGSQMDNIVIIPLQDLRDLTGKEDEVSTIVVHVLAGEDISVVEERVKKELNRRRDDEDFEVFTPEQLLEQVKSILNVVNIILIGIAAISLLVGAIGIMNSMYTAVIERTKDIGVMKSIGASNANILVIFLLESGLMGLVGGIIGVSLGLGLAFLVQAVAVTAGVSLLVIKINWNLIMFALGFSYIIGTIAGTYPAYKAARLKPVDALRYE